MSFLKKNSEKEYLKSRSKHEVRSVKSCLKNFYGFVTNKGYTYWCPSFMTNSSFHYVSAESCWHNAQNEFNRAATKNKDASVINIVNDFISFLENKLQNQRFKVSQQNDKFVLSDPKMQDFRLISEIENKICNAKKMLEEFKTLSKRYSPAELLNQNDSLGARFGTSSG